MSGKTTYLSNALLDYVLRGTAFSAPASVYVGLFTTAPTVGGGGVEVSGGSYARQAASFDPASGGSTVQGCILPFPDATADWGTVVAFGIFDSEVGGNLLFFGDLDEPKTVFAGDSFGILDGGIQIAETAS